MRWNSEKLNRVAPYQQPMLSYHRRFMLSVAEEKELDVHEFPKPNRVLGNSPRSGAAGGGSFGEMAAALSSPGKRPF
jgi:hypothetical protein